MALITCPECNNQVSDSAVSCPHCGYVLNKQTTVEPTPAPEKKEELKKTYFTGKSKGGSLLIVWGFIFLLGSLAFLLIFFPIGIVLLLITLGRFGAAFSQMKSKHGSCPYCGNAVDVEKTATTYKCVHCKKISNVREDGLETIPN